jgi:hypothetical protein
MSSIYDRPPGNQLMKNKLTSGSPRLDHSEHYRMETVRTLDEDYVNTIYTDMGDKVGYEYAIVEEEHTLKKRILPQNTVFSAEQSQLLKQSNRRKITDTKW